MGTPVRAPRVPVASYPALLLALRPNTKRALSQSTENRKVEESRTHVQGVGLNHAIFASEEVIFSRLGVKDGQKCPLKDSSVAAIMLATPCRVSGDHPALTLCAKIFLPLVSPPLPVGWDTALFAGKYPHVHLVPLNVGRKPLISNTRFSDFASKRQFCDRAAMSPGDTTSDVNRDRTAEIYKAAHRGA